MRGCFNTLRWARNNSCPWSTMTFEWAVAQADRPEMLEELWSMTCPWGSGVCKLAARKGHVFSLIWALEHGFPLGNAIPIAGQFGQLKVLELFREIGTPWHEWSGALVRTAAFGSRATLEWLVANGCPVRDEELATIEPELAAKIMAAAAAVEAQAAAAPAAAQDADAAPAHGVAL
jgi:hypothetical protein